MTPKDNTPLSVDAEKEAANKTYKENPIMGTTLEFPEGSDENLDEGAKPTPLDREIKMEGEKNSVPCDLSSFRLSQDFSLEGGIKPVLGVVPVRKPDKQEFFRVHPDQAWKLGPAGVIELRATKEVYLVTGKAAENIRDLFATKIIFTAVTRHGQIFLWPVFFPNQNGRQNNWHVSALAAAQKAQTSWIRVQANMALGQYDIAQATGILSEPEWPKIGFDELVLLAFKDHIIDSVNHPVIRELRGQI
jgi:hypothetical protein